MLNNMGQQPLDNKSLMAELQRELLRENDMWNPLSYKPTSAGIAVEIGREQRNQAVRWLAQLTRKFHFLPETFALSVNILDRFLQSVKARPKHLNCIGVAAFYLAAKTVEEDERLPITLELVQQSQCGRSVSEVLRMERCILDKLGWDLRACTPLAFLHIFHALLMANYPRLLDGFVNVARTRQLWILTGKLEMILMNASCLRYSPSVIALSLLSLELEKFWKNWTEPTLKLAALVGLDTMTVAKCRDCLSVILKTSPASPMMDGVLPPTLYVPTKTGRVTAVKRKVEQIATDSEDEGDVEEENIYDGIKRLYSEETTAVGG